MKTGVEAVAAGSASFARFFASGGFNTLVTYLLYLVLLRKLPYQASFSIAFATGIVLAYLMNRYLVFRQPGGRAGPLWVALIYGGQYLVNLGLVSVWVAWLGLPAALAPLFAIALTLPFTYLLNRLVFSADPQQERARIAESLRLLWGRRATAAIVLLVGLPAFSLALNAVSWLRYGLDLPFFDDWRGYDSWDIDSLDFIYLWRPLNDTLTPIGLALDALAQRYLDGNSLAYQLLTMLGVLGLLMVLQWKLLRSALGDPLKVAVCFVFTLLMLQPGSYWGRENLAYQQALPLVFILAALWLGIARERREAWVLPAIAGLGVLAGLTYISGAFGALAAGGGVIVVALLCRPGLERGRLLASGGALAAGGAITVALQAAFVVVPQRGETHVGGQTMAWPTEPEFWSFYLGKLARSLLLPEAFPAFSLAMVLIGCALLAAIAVHAVRKLRTAEGPGPGELRFAAILAALVAMVLAYLGLVAAGRTHFRPAEVSSLIDVFAHGFQRFHFFWATLLWPWAVAGLMLAADRWLSVAWFRRWRGALGVAVVVLAVLGMVQGGALDHVEVHHRTSFTRHGTADCLMAKLQQGEPIHCSEFNLPDLSSAYAYASHVGASFVRYFRIQPLPLGLDTPAPWFRLTRDAARTRTVDMAPLAGRTFRPGADPQMLIDVADAQAMGACAALDVSGRIKPAAKDEVTLFFRPWGLKDFSPLSSMARPIAPGAGDFHFRIEHPLGFEPGLRIDPVRGGGDFVLEELEVRCRLTLRTEGTKPFYSVVGAKVPAALHHLEPVNDGAGKFRAGDRPHAAFRTTRKYDMATCRVLEVDAVYNVEQDDVAQLFFRPRGTPSFSERDSKTLPVRPGAAPAHTVFVVESAAGFEDELRLDPVRRPQLLQFTDVKVRCLKRTLRHKSW